MISNQTSIIERSNLGAKGGLQTKVTISENHMVF